VGARRYVRVVSNASIWTYEARRAGPAALALPLLGALGVIVAALVAHLAHDTSPHNQGLTMVRLVSDAFPVTAGLAAAAIVGRERMLELQLSVSTDYASTLRRRLTVLVAVALFAAVACVSVLGAQDQWVHPASGMLAVLVPAAPAIMLIGGGVWAGVRLGSAAAASTTVLGLWLAQLLVLDRLVGVWQLNRALLILAGIGFLLAARHRLADSEGLLATAQRGEQ